MSSIMLASKKNIDAEDDVKSQIFRYSSPPLGTGNISSSTRQLPPPPPPPLGKNKNIDRINDSEEEDIESILNDINKGQSILNPNSNDIGLINLRPRPTSNTNGGFVLAAPSPHSPIGIDADDMNLGDVDIDLPMIPSPPRLAIRPRTIKAIGHRHMGNSIKFLPIRQEATVGDRDCDEY